jgi:predicted nucleic acid-binding protein
VYAQRPTPAELSARIAARGPVVIRRQSLRAAADALFVALAERLGEPLATKDAALAAAASEHSAIDVLSLVERR